MALTIDAYTRELTYRSAEDEIALLVARTSAPPNPGRFEDIGSIGNVWISGIQVGQEYNPKLRGEQAIAAYEEMRRSDGQVAGVLRVLKLPLLRANWDILAASDEPLDVEVAQFVHDNLMGGLQDQTWDTVLRQFLTMYDFGHAVSVTQWIASDDGKVRVKRLTPLLPVTLYRWWPDDEGRLLAITQRVWKTTGTQFPKVGDSAGDDTYTMPTSHGQYHFPTLPADRIVHLALDQEGANFTGVSVLRAAYKHWFYKQQLYQIDAIAAERNAMGVPWFKEPQGAQKADRDRAALVLSSLHAHQKGYVLVPFGWEFGIEGVSGRVRDVMPSIEEHNRQIAVSVLAQFLNLVQGSGSFALSKDESSFFLQSLQAVATLICDGVNQQLIRELVDLNYQVERYPTLTVSDLDHRNIAEYARGVAMLYSAGAITNNVQTENVLRDMLGLPDLPTDASPEGGGELSPDNDTMGPSSNPEDEAIKTEAAKLAAERDRVEAVGLLEVVAHEEDPEKAVAALKRLRLIGARQEVRQLRMLAAQNRADVLQIRGALAQEARLEQERDEVAQPAHLSMPPTVSGRWRELRQREQVLDLANIEETWQQAKNDLIAAVGPIIAKQIIQMAKVAQRLADAGKPVDPEKVDVPYKSEVSAALVAAMLAQYQAGGLQVDGELQRTRERSKAGAELPPPPEAGGPDEPSKATMQGFNYQAAAIAGTLAIGLKQGFAQHVNRNMGKPITAEGLQAALGPGAQRQVARAAGPAVHEAVNVGRTAEAKRQGAMYFEITGIMDQNQCDPCAELDGTTYAVDSGDLDDLQPPLESICDGGGNCRCLLTYYFEEEASE